MIDRRQIPVKISLMTWFIYIIECQADGSLYTGITNNLDNRLKMHQQGTGAKYTRGRGHLTLMYSETAQNRSEASKREHAIKKMSKEEKRAFIRGM